MKRAVAIQKEIIKQGIDDEYIIGKLKERTEEGDIRALFKLMKLMQYDVAEQPPVDVVSLPGSSNLVGLLENLEERALCYDGDEEAEEP